MNFSHAMERLNGGKRVSWLLFWRPTLYCAAMALSDTILLLLRTCPRSQERKGPGGEAHGRYNMC